MGQEKFHWFDDLGMIVEMITFGGSIFRWKALDGCYSTIFKTYKEALDSLRLHHESHHGDDDGES